MDEFAKSFDFDVPTIKQKQLKDSVLGNLRCRVYKSISPDRKAPEIRQPKSLLRYCQELERLIIEKHG